MLEPQQAADLISGIDGVSPVLSKRGSRKGQHIQKAYRYAVPGRHPRHISIVSAPTTAGATVYVNRLSVMAVQYPDAIAGITVSEFYPKGYVGKTGDKGLSAAAGGLSSLLPANNDVYRLSVQTETGFRALLDWYCGSAASGVAAPHTATANMIDAPDPSIERPRSQAEPSLSLDSLVDAFVDAFTGTAGRSLAQGRGIRSGRDWFATIYTGGTTEGNVIEVAVEPTMLSRVLGNCPVRHIKRWIIRQQETTGTLAAGHRPSEPWPCIGFAATTGFEAMLDDWREFKKSWLRHGKPHFSEAPVASADRGMDEPAGDGHDGMDALLPSIDTSTSKGNADADVDDDGNAGDTLMLRAIRTRRGQLEFRRALLDAYQGRCAFSGCAVVDVLEAAHIHFHADGGDYATSNGILLRADLHTLFDLHLLAVDDAGRIQVSRTLKDTEYARLHAQPMRIPSTDSDAPSRAALAMRLQALRRQEADNRPHEQ